MPGRCPIRPELLLALILSWAWATSAAEPPEGPSAGTLPVTNGLIRWWPNLFDVRDEVTGQEGVVMGVLPPVPTGAVDETEFGVRTGWVQLQPAITNEVFTIALWVRRLPSADHQRLLEQATGQLDWLLQAEGSQPSLYFVGPLRHQERDRTEPAALAPHIWHHVAVGRRPDGTCVVWVDGKRTVDGRLSHPWPAQSRWLTVGNTVQGADQCFQGGMRDLCAFDRLLADGEVRLLHAAGVPGRPARNTAARRMATARATPVEVQTNILQAAPGSWIHRRFTTEDGLPGNTVKAIHQARDGYLWVGTDEGLARFDGRSFRAFTERDTPALKAIGQVVWSLSEDRDGTLWAGVQGGLLRIRHLEFKAFTNGLPQRFILQAEPAGDGNLWVAGFNHGLPRGPLHLRRYDPESGRSSAEVVVPGHVRRLVVATNGVWLAAEQPPLLQFWDGMAAAPTVVAAIDYAAPGIRLGSARVAEQARLRAWRGGGEVTNWWGEVDLGPGLPPFHWLWPGDFRRPWAARWNGPVDPGESWLGVFHALARRRPGQFEELPIGEQAFPREILCVAPNREGGTWFGTEEDGLHWIQERLIRVFTKADGLAGNDVRSICAAPDGSLWVGTPGGLNRYRDGIWTFHGEGRLRTVAVDASGRPWEGMQGFGEVMVRRDRFEPRQRTVSIGRDWQDPNCIRFGSDGRVWIACERGLTWIRPDRLRETPEGNWEPDPSAAEPGYGRYEVGKELPAMIPLGLTEDGDGSIWLGSRDNGLVRVSGDGIRHFTDRDGLPGRHCVPVHCDRDGAVWITSPAGLTRFRNGRFQTVGEPNGMPRDVLLDLIEDDLGHFWISGKRGIHQVARAQLEAYFSGTAERVHSFALGVRDGLLTPECSSLHYPTLAKTPDGRLWVSTRHGLATFDPRQARLDSVPLPTVIEKMVVNLREVPTPALPAPAAPLQLAPGSGRRLEFHYTATSLVAADRVRFRYRLDSSDADWSPPTDLRVAFYTNLKPGKYRFRVEAANAHGLWSGSSTTLDFAILPRFWQTGMFQMATGAMVAALGITWHRVRLARQRRLQERSHLESLTDEKARIAADMHDELGATLTQIAILGEVTKNNLGNAVQTRSSLEQITEVARELTSRLGDLVWATNPRNDSLDNLAAYLRELAASQLAHTAIQPRLEFPGPLPAGHVSATFRRNVLLVMKEALHNVLKHSGAREVRVALTIEGSSLVLRIEDDGRGFDPAARADAGNGLNNMRKRVRDLDGEFKLSSQPGGGTRIELTAPLKLRP